MAATSSRGVKICITKAGANGTPITGALSKSDPATLTGTGYTAKTDDIIYVKGGNSSLSNKIQIVGGGASATSLTLVGSDTSADADTTGGVYSHFSPNDMACLCWSEMSISVDTPSTVSVATYCDPTATLPSAVSSAGQISFSGFVDSSSAEYLEMVKASEDNVERYMRITLPNNNGYLVAPITFSSLTYSFPLDGAVSYSGSGVLGSKFKHLHV